jgi:hypothetical protein
MSGSPGMEGCQIERSKAAQFYEGSISYENEEMDNKLPALVT